MFETSTPFSGISVNDLEAAKAFYGGTLGFPYTEAPAGITVTLPGGAHLWVYAKPDHTPATFTVLNFPVDDIDAAVDGLHAAGISTDLYPKEWLPTDDRGILRGRSVDRGPDIAWFTDPAGNVLAVLDDGDM